MALGINYQTANTDFTPIVQFDARAGRMFRTDRAPDGGGGWATEKTDLTLTFKAIFDLENIETGWMKFTAGQPPDIRTVPLDQNVGEQPSEEHRHGFRLMLMLSNACADGKPTIREFTSNAKAASEGMDLLHNAYLAEAKNHPGQLPVVVLKGTVTKTITGGGQKSTAYVPQWSIEAWVPRPAELVQKPRAAPDAQQPGPKQPGPAATGSTVISTAELGKQANVTPLKPMATGKEFG